MGSFKWVLQLLGASYMPLVGVELQNVVYHGEPFQGGLLEHGFYAEWGKGVVMESGEVKWVSLVRRYTNGTDIPWFCRPAADCGINWSSRWLIKGLNFGVRDYAAKKEWFPNGVLPSGEPPTVRAVPQSANQQVVIPADSLRVGETVNIAALQFKKPCYYCGGLDCRCPKTWSKA